MNYTPELLKMHIGENAKELMQAKADAALYERLRGAASEVNKLTKIGNELLAALAKAEGDEQKERDDHIAKVRCRNLQITVDNPEKGKNADITFSYEGDVYDSNAHCNLPQQKQIKGIGMMGSLHPDILSYIVRRKANLLPAFITDLAPGDPFAAMQAYHNSKTRNGGHYN